MYACLRVGGCVQFIIKKKKKNVTQVLLFYQAVYCADRYTIILKLKRTAKWRVMQSHRKIWFLFFFLFFFFVDYISRIFSTFQKCLQIYIAAMFSRVCTFRRIFIFHFLWLFPFFLWFFFSFSVFVHIVPVSVYSFFFFSLVFSSCLPFRFRFKQHEKGVVHGRVGLVKTSEVS